MNRMLSKNHTIVPAGKVTDPIAKKRQSASGFAFFRWYMVMARYGRDDGKHLKLKDG
jgi:hypothetical protein